MTIKDVTFADDCYTIVSELQNQLHANGIPLLNKIIDTPKNVQVCCPYHKGGQERRPSAGIKKSDGTFHCLACGETHSLDEMISHCFGHYEMFDRFGWNWLLKNFASISVEERKNVDIDFGRRAVASTNSNIHNTAVNSVSDDKADGQDKKFVSEEELDRYRYVHPYWAKRGVTSERILEIFDLGYDAESETITFPVRDADGNTLFVARRSVHTKYFNYPAGAEKPIYGLYEYKMAWKQAVESRGGRSNGKTYTMQKLSEVFICESMIDALLLWQAGFYAFALNGLGSASQLEVLRELPVRKYILCTDNDKAGEDARKVLRTALKSKIITEIRFPSNRKDVGECSSEEIKNIKDWERWR